MSMRTRSGTSGGPAGDVYYGGDYNPEQWPRETWAEDVLLMREAGVNLVTVGVFSWARLEPSEGDFDFAWLREVLDLLERSGIGADLSTPTASPPPWATTRYEDVAPVDDRGHRYSHGSRQHVCILSPNYRRLASRVVARLVDEVAHHPAVQMFHVHNEYACHVPYCYCDHHAQAFRTWLTKRYSSLEELNRAWGTAFWSQSYGSFEEILPPRLTPTYPNPAQLLDYKRFSSDAFLEEFLEEKQILRQARPDVPVTTNFMGFYKPLDYFTWAPHLDIVSTDNYPDPAGPDSTAVSARHYDLIRSLNKSAPWMVMEQTPSRVNWRPHNVPKAPGQMRALGYQALARGASGLLFFQWRASRSGAEKFHSAMVPHAGQASPVWSEVVRLGKDLARTGEVGDAPVVANVAVLFSWASWWAMEGPAQPARDLTLDGQLTWMGRPLYERQVTIDFCRPNEDLSSYKAVLLPSLYLLSETEGANILSYVGAGGTAFISYWSGIADENDTVYLGPYGGPLRPLMGCDVVDVAPLAQGEHVDVEWEDGRRTTADFWADVAVERDGKVLARVVSGPWAGTPAVVETPYGAGTAYYIGARLDDEGMSLLYDRVAVTTGGPRGVQASSTLGQTGIERTLRRAGADRYEFLVNHGATERNVTVTWPGTELLSGSAASATLALAPWGVAVVHSKEA